MPGMNGSWLDWVGVEKGIESRNAQVYQVLEAFFSEAVDIDYDDVVKDPPAKVIELEANTYNVFEDAEERRGQLWSTVSYTAAHLSSAASTGAL